MMQAEIEQGDDAFDDEAKLGRVPNPKRNNKWRRIRTFSLVLLLLGAIVVAVTAVYTKQAKQKRIVGDEAYEDGYTDGYKEGFQEGYDEGYGEGYNEGYSDFLNADRALQEVGEINNLEDMKNFNIDYKEKYKSGYTDGYTDGYNDGFKEGDSDGYEEGYDSADNDN